MVELGAGISTLTEVTVTVVSGPKAETSTTGSLLDGKTELDDVGVGSINSGPDAVITDDPADELVREGAGKTEEKDGLKDIDFVLVACVRDGVSRMVTDTVVPIAGGGL